MSAGEDKTLVDVLKGLIQPTSIWADGIILFLGVIGVVMAGHGLKKLYNAAQFGESEETWGYVAMVILGALMGVSSIVIAKVSFIFAGGQ